MSYQTLQYDDYYIVIEFTFDGEYLICDNWVAYDADTDIEVQIPDVETSKQIEEMIEEWLDSELITNYSSYVEARESAYGDYLYDSWKEK